MKAVIYLRTSTEEQEPENQKKACLELARNRGYEVKEILLEQLSGFKQINRPKYEKVKEMARKGEINAVIVWALDRWVRNRDTLIEDTVILRNYGCKLHSVSEAWLESINIDGSLGRTIQDFLLGLMGSIAEMESQRKSERIKLAVRKDGGITKSYRGKKWGRKRMKKVEDQIIELYNKGLTMRQITDTVYYWDKNKHKKYVSLGYVHKVISESKEQNHK